jgi:hypothetical protein
MEVPSAKHGQMRVQFETDAGVRALDHPKA